jgi:hypothetical protein
MGCQARMQMSIHDEKVVGLALARRGYVPIHMFSRAPPDSITDLAMWRERRKAGLDQGGAHSGCPRLSDNLGNC